MLEELRKEVCERNLEIPLKDLAVGTSGNVSGRDHETNLVVIKPSGVRYEELTPDNMVIVDLDGNVVEGGLKPSVDTETHLVVYRHCNDVYGITHTHSPYATSFALLGQPIPVYLTTLAHEFGDTIPVGAYAEIGGEQVGKEIVRALGKGKAVLMKSHGVFTVGPTASASFKTAAMLEEAAKTIHLALQRGQPEVLPADEIERCYHFYHEKYGQK